MKCLYLSNSQQDDATFTITVDGKTFHFQAQDSHERERWIRALEDTVMRHNQTRRVSSGLRKSALLSTQGEAPTIVDFDKRLTETDCYLQILLNQVQALKVKIDDPQTTPEDREKYEDIAEKAVAMTESIKHGIVLLQIAKNATIPEASAANNSTSGLELSTHEVASNQLEDASRDSPVSRPSRSSIGKTTPKVMAAIENPFSDANIETGIELGSECQEKQQSSSQKSTPSASLVSHPFKSADVPVISYSSSEDEDFFDAEDDEDDEAVTAASGDLRTPPATLDLSSIDESDKIATFEPDDIQSPMTPLEGKMTL